jgi:hypothetical protein
VSSLSTPRVYRRGLIRMLRSSILGEWFLFQAKLRDLTSPRVKTFRDMRGRYLGDHLPASRLVATPGLVHEEMMLEVEVMAVV